MSFLTQFKQSTTLLKNTSFQSKDIAKPYRATQMHPQAEAFSARFMCMLSKANN